MIGKILDMTKTDVVVYLDNGSIVNLSKWSLEPNIKVGDIVNVENPKPENDSYIGFI